MSEYLGEILLALVVDVDRGLRPGKADVDIVGKHGGHDLIRALPSGKLDIQPLFFEVAEIQRGILRGVENGMGDFADGDLDLLIPTFAGRQKQEQRGGERDAGNAADMFHHKLPVLSRRCARKGHKTAVKKGAFGTPYRAPFMHGMAFFAVGRRR